MNQTDQFLEYFKDNDNVLTLGKIMGTGFSCEYRKHISLLRQRGYRIKCEINRSFPSMNEYKLLEKKWDGCQAIMF